MNRTIIIGDVHGCYQETVNLLEKCKLSSSDRVIFVGDLVDRGPDNGRCLDLAMHLEKSQGSNSCVMGNHEDKHLNYHRTGRVDDIPPTHKATRSQLRDEHYEFMKAMPLYIRLPEHNAVVVHAGVFPGIPIEEQESRHLLHIQMINPEQGKSSKWPSRVGDESGWKFWTNLYDGPEKIIFGHSVFDKPLITDKVFGIDGGVCFGRKLHALILPEWEIVSVDALVPEIPNSKVKLYNVHGDVSTFS